jgi:hypothetical protein
MNRYNTQDNKKHKQTVQEHTQEKTKYLNNKTNIKLIIIHIKLVIKIRKSEIRKGNDNETTYKKVKKLD